MCFKFLITLLKRKNCLVQVIKGLILELAMSCSQKQYTYLVEWISKVAKERDFAKALTSSISNGEIFHVSKGKDLVLEIFKVSVGSGSMFSAEEKTVSKECITKQNGKFST
jgi:predicted Mrr-cat superfamily restriction endonuclease